MMTITMKQQGAYAYLVDNSQTEEGSSAPLPAVRRRCAQNHVFPIHLCTCAPCTSTM